MPYPNQSRRGEGRYFSRPAFNNRGPRGPVEMHKAICSNCGRDCEVPFRPTGAKPVFCSNCFERNQGSDTRRPEGRNNGQSDSFESRPSFRSERPKQMFDAVCDNCGNNCQVPFRPTGGKPVYCSNCYGKNEPGNKDIANPQPNLKTQIEAINIKLDQILKLISPKISVVAEKEMNYPAAELTGYPAESSFVNHSSSAKLARDSGSKIEAKPTKKLSAKKLINKS